MPDTAILSKSSTHDFAHAIWSGAGGNPAMLDRVSFHGDRELPSIFAVSGLAAASVGAAALAVAELIAAGERAEAPEVDVDHRLASVWYGESIRPIGWELPPPWDPIAGDYPAADGWIRLHTNAPHHRDAALAVLGAPAERSAVAEVVTRWRKGDLESAIVQHNGCAAAMRDLNDWSRHPNGAAVAAEPLLWWDGGDAWPDTGWRPRRGRPLAGVRVLDLTRVLAGPVATRFLAGFGADVLRIDPPDWDEPGVVPSVTLGKRCARLNLRRAEDRRQFEALLASADVLVHGYRPDALARLGLDAAARRRIRPGLVDVCHDAYGWTGPWRDRRGFDSLVQMSSGIAAEGMRGFAREKPHPLPVQALDHATGYVVATAAVRGLTRRLTEGVGSGARTSLARIAALLTSGPIRAPGDGFAPVADGDFNPDIEATAWGPARRMRPPVAIDGAPLRWAIPAGPLGSSDPVWASSHPA
jgi:crotonobetainyl-CoA:carnitine CoA-transferase CaiB-like acyl-CoA transferase